MSLLMTIKWTAQLAYDDGYHHGATGKLNKPPRNLYRFDQKCVDSWTDGWNDGEHDRSMGDVVASAFRLAGKK